MRQSGARRSGSVEGGERRVGGSATGGWLFLTPYGLAGSLRGAVACAPSELGLLAPNDPSSMEKAWSLALWSVLVCRIAIITDNSKGDGTGTIPRQKGRSK